VLTVKTAAEMAGVSAALVYIWVGEGVLPHFRLGKPGSSKGAIRIAEDDLEAFLFSHKHGERAKESIPPAQKRKLVLKHLKLRS
jgi:excisionase family DNA binding protein